MALTTIDGKLYLPLQELDFLYSVQLINMLAGQQPRVIAEAQAEEEIGYQRGKNQYAEVWPERYLIKKVREQITPRAYGSGNSIAKCQVGEESINGHVYGSEEEPVRYDPFLGKPIDVPWADLGLVGPASLIGKVALELCRRLELELNEDERARMEGSMVWEEKDDPPAGE